MPCLQVVPISLVALDGILVLPGNYLINIGECEDANMAYPLSAVMKTSATFLPLATLAAAPVSSLMVHQSTSVPCASARSAMGSCGYRYMSNECLYGNSALSGRALTATRYGKLAVLAPD